MPTTGAALDPRVRGQLRSVAIIVAVTLALLVVSGWFLTAGWAAFVLIVFGIFFVPAIALLAGGLVLHYTVEGWGIARDPNVPRRQRTVALLSPIGATLILVLAAPSACSFGQWGRRQAMLNTLEPAFRQMMVAAASGRAIPVFGYEGHSIAMAVEKGKPLRYYFRMTGLSDNSTGFIYDPTDAVRAATGWGPNRTFTAPPDVREWFGGDILWCERVRDHYHYCGLT